MARKPICDTSVFSDYADYVDRIILSVLFPTVVLFELVATSLDEATLQKYQRWRVLLNKNDCLINPTASDWWETSKAIRRLYLLASEQPTKIKTLRNDALIARLAVMHDGFVVTHDIDDGFVVTHDIDDFLIIQKVMPRLQIMSAQEFFNY